jgi:hypothetical protein
LFATGLAAVGFAGRRRTARRSQGAVAKT